jgi:predicted dehydrogenase
MNENHQANPQNPPPAVSRRQFLVTAGTAAGGAAVGVGLSGCASRTPKAAAAAAAAVAPAVVQAQPKQTINAVVIGGGGRGRGAGADFMNAAKIVGAEAKIVGLAEAFSDRLDQCVQAWQKEGIAVPQANCHVGLDSYLKVLAIPGVNYVIIATPPGFKAAQFKAAVEAGKNVFTEKPVAVDGPTARMMYAAGELATKKGLKVAAGTQRRHRPSYIESIKRIHDGAIGDVIALRAYWVNGGPIWHRAEEEARATSDLERQTRNWYHYIWLCGDHICEQHVHDIDVCNWIMGNQHPIKCWGQGSRQQLGDKSGEIWDNFDVEFEYANGVRLFSYCGQIKREWASVSEHVHGAKGMADLYDGRNMIRPKDGTVWRPTGITNDNGYVNEHVDLINAILKDTELNETKNVTNSTLTAIMGREAAYSGAAVEWDQILNSTWKYGPELLYTDLSKLTWGAFRTLKPPMPSKHNILKDPPMVAGA